MRRIWRNNGLTIILLAMFAISLIGHWLTGWHFENEELARDGEAAISLGAYARDPQFLSTVFEGYRWSPLAIAGCALALVGLLLALRAPSPAR